MTFDPVLGWLSLACAVVLALLWVFDIDEGRWP